MKRLLLVLMLLFIVAPLATGVTTVVGGCRAEVGDPD